MSKNTAVYLSIVGGVFYIVGGLITAFIVTALGGFLSGLRRSRVY
jgi:hypothetical protein